MGRVDSVFPGGGPVPLRALEAVTIFLTCADHGALYVAPGGTALSDMTVDRLQPLHEDLPPLKVSDPFACPLCGAEWIIEVEADGPPPV